MSGEAERARLRVEVVCALRDRQVLRAFEVEAGTTLGEAIERSGVLEEFPEIAAASCEAGVFGKLAPRTTVLRDGDRVEIYRPLIASPKEARRDRAERVPLKKKRR